MSDYEKPQQRKGMTLTAVQWDRSGKVRRTVYEPIRKARPEPVDEPVANRRRGLLI